ncbi:MAG: SDR family oxidoreductase [Erythrobacter sp.]|uniref:SDR family oxidoreductase n=1 Tax=Erythrobacter sp. TaxID=1042 RepID=UPI001B0F2EB6|nr:SDR family oxidoreductase [Erythrobacter sp.]MBO6531353.1 SDR family oxidoreductase [Erythrobacter sp.]
MSRRILVTGSASGIGAALAEQLSSAGDHVIGLDRHDAEILCDLTDAAQIDRAIAAIAGELDGVALVAGVPGTADPETIFAVNTMAPQRLAEGLASKMRDGAAIVAVSSVTAARCPLDPAACDAWQAMTPVQLASQPGIIDGKTAYEYSKGLLNRWVQVAALRFHSLGIRVNGVSPGAIETPILRDFEISIGEEHLARAEQMTGRHGRPDEIASVIRFLLGPDAGWINGADIKVDGGLHALRAAGKTVGEPA